MTEGDIVKIGDPIIQVTNKTAQLNTENARLAADYAAIDANTNKLNELKINIDVAKSKEANDSLLLERQRNLWAQQIGSQNELEQREKRSSISESPQRKNRLCFSIPLFTQRIFGAAQCDVVFDIFQSGYK